MRLQIVPALLLSASLAACGGGNNSKDKTAPQQNVATATPAVAAPDIDVATLKTVTKTISADDFEGRAPMTPAETKTINYVAGQFQAAGLKPANKGSWFQEVPLVEITADPKRADMTFRKDGKPLLTAAYGNDEVVWTKRVQPDVKLDNSALVFVGYGVNAPEKGWNDYAGTDVKGKTVVILVNDPDWETKTLDGPFGGRAMTYYGRWTYKYEEAARQGADGAIIIHQTEPAAYGWATVKSSWTGPQLDLDSAGGNADRVKAEGWVTKDIAERLLKASGHSLPELAAAAKQKGFKAIPLGITVSTELHNTIRKEKSHNVIGVLPGTKRPDEYVLYSAHWDHLGHCEPDKTGDDICNGALDNGTGTAGLIALARAYSAAGPAERSVMFLSVTGEESGLLGSQYYADHPLAPLAKTVGGVNMDGLNVVGPTHDLVIVGAGKSELEDIATEVAKSQGRYIEPEPTPEKGFYYRSDHFSFAKKGVPMLDADSGIDVIGKGKAFGQAAADDYTANRYHQPSDEYDPNWNWDGAVEDLDLYYRVGRRLADSDIWPNWRKGDEFRAIRDKSRAAAGTAGAE